MAVVPRKQQRGARCAWPERRLVEFLDYYRSGHIFF